MRPAPCPQPGDDQEPPSWIIPRRTAHVSAVLGIPEARPKRTRGCERLGVTPRTMYPQQSPGAGLDLTTGLREEVMSGGWDSCPPELTGWKG